MAADLSFHLRGLTVVFPKVSTSAVDGKLNFQRRVTRGRRFHPAPCRAAPRCTTAFFRKIGGKSNQRSHGNTREVGLQPERAVIEWGMRESDDMRVQFPPRAMRYYQRIENFKLLIGAFLSFVQCLPVKCSTKQSNLFIFSIVFALLLVHGRIEWTLV